MRQKQLNSGYRMPVLGLGTWKLRPAEAGAAVTYALAQAGYRHVDCASIYENQAEIGAALAKLWGQAVKREQVFITSKLWNTDHRPERVERACRQTLADLRLEYLDLYLMHWGIAFKPGREGIIDQVSIRETWIAMEELAQKGLAKSIGVANFTTMMLADLLTYAKIKPAVNQIELHPYNSQAELVAWCQDEGIAVTAYSPLGNPVLAAKGGPQLLDDKTIKTIAAKHKKTPAQICLNWAIDRGTMAIPKSSKPERIRENIDVFNFTLTDEDRRAINALNRNYRLVNPIDWWGIPYFG